MEEEKQINTNEKINNNIKLDKDKITDDINKNEKTLDNESSNQISNIQKNNISENINKCEIIKNEERINDNKNKENKDIITNNNLINEEEINNLNIKDEMKNKEMNNENKNNINENVTKLKSALKGSNTKIKKIKKQIMQVFDEKLIMDKIDQLQIDNNPFNNIDYFYKFQEDYENKIDKLFNDKMKKLDEINEKYEPEINELNLYLQEEKAFEEKDNKNDKKNMEEDNVPSAIQIMFDSIMEDKNNEVKQLNNEYLENRKIIKNDYMKDIESDKIMKNGIYFNKLFEDNKNNILKIIKPLNNKKVNFFVSEEKQKEDNKNNIKE